VNRNQLRLWSTIHLHWTNRTNSIIGVYFSIISPSIQIYISFGGTNDISEDITSHDTLYIHTVLHKKINYFPFRHLIFAPRSVIHIYLIVYIDDAKACQMPPYKSARSVRNKVLITALIIPSSYVWYFCIISTEVQKLAFFNIFCLRNRQL